MKKNLKLLLIDIILIMAIIICGLILLLCSAEKSYASEEKSYIISLSDNIYTVAEIERGDFTTKLVVDGTTSPYPEIELSDSFDEKSYILNKKGVPFRSSTEVILDNIICMIPHGAEIYTLGYLEPDWEVIEYNGQIGFVKNTDVSEEEPKNFLQKVWDYILNHL